MYQLKAILGRRKGKITAEGVDALVKIENFFREGLGHVISDYTNDTRVPNGNPDITPSNSKYVHIKIRDLVDPQQALIMLTREGFSIVDSKLVRGHYDHEIKEIIYPSKSGQTKIK
tara:strand:- start:437 stop:784 length:348 start_codon:yes stop_codon:yes gene_type:complete